MKQRRYLLGRKGRNGRSPVIGGRFDGAAEIAYDLVLKGKRPVIVEMAGTNFLMTKGLLAWQTPVVCRDLYCGIMMFPIYKYAKLLEYH